MFLSNHRIIIQMFNLLILLTTATTHATISYVSQGHSPEGRPVFFLGLEHWSNDRESIKQGALLAALFEKSNDGVFLVEYNDLYEQFSPHNKVGKPALRQVAYPHYAYKYPQALALARTYAATNVPLATLDKRVAKLSGFDKSSAQACPLTLFLDTIGDKSTSDRIVSIDQRHQYLMLSALLTGIKKNPNLQLEELVPDLGLDEDFLESFSLQNLVETAEQLALDLTTKPTEHAALTELMQEWATCLREHLTELKQALDDVEEEVCIDMNIATDILSLKSPTLVFIDRWLKTLQAQATEKHKTRSARARHIRLNISRISDLLSEVFNYHTHLEALNKFLDQTNKLVPTQPIFLIGSTDHVAAVQFSLECIGYTFDRPLMDDEQKPQQTVATCTKILHTILTHAEAAA